MDAVAAVVSHAELTGEAVARFHRMGFMVVTDLTTREDLDTVSRLLASLYRRFAELMDARRAHDLGSERHDARPILEINQTVDLEPRLAETLTFRRCASLAERLLGRPVEYRFDHAIYKPPFQRRRHVLAPGRSLRAGAQDSERALLGAAARRHPRHGLHGVHPWQSSWGAGPPSPA